MSVIKESQGAMLLNMGSDRYYFNSKINQLWSRGMLSLILIVLCQVNLNSNELKKKNNVGSVL